MRFIKLAAVAALTLASLASAPATLAAGVHDPPPPPPYTQPVPQQVFCNTSDPSWAWQLAGKVPVISKANAINTSGQPFCIEAAGTWQTPGPVGLRVLSDLQPNGAWEAYPYTGVGCQYGLYTRGTDLPVQVRRVSARAVTSFSWKRNGAQGNFNVAYDIWLDHRRQCTTQNNAAEIMLWLRPNTPLNSSFRLAWIGGRLFWWTWWITCNPPHTACWHYVQFRWTGPRLALQGKWFVLSRVSGLHLLPFLQFLEQQGIIRPADEVTSVHAGYEIVWGGKGLQTTWFSAHV